MKKNVRCLVFLLSLILLLSACAPSGGGSASTEESRETVTEADLMKDVPKGDYDGYEFKILVTNQSWAAYSMVGEESADPVSTAVFRRNTAVQEKLDILITQKEAGGAEIDEITRVQRFAQDPLNYDAIWHAASRIGVQVQEDYYYDLTTVGSIHLNEPWWYSDFNDTINLGDSQYTLMGALNMVYYSAFGLCAFNKNLLASVDENADLFALYDAGEWTWEAMYTYMDLVDADDGDGEMLAGDDQFGLAMHYNALKSLLTTAGVTITDTDENGFPVFNGISERFVNAYKFINEKITNPSLSIIPSITAGYSDYTADGGTYQTAFSEGRVLFQLESAGALSRNKGSNVDYGLIGYPKYDSSVAYSSPVYYGLSGLCVLQNTIDIERTGVILENLCAHSYGTLDSAYVENVLYYKYSKDPQSKAMMEQIFRIGTVDIAYIYNWAAIILRVEDAQKSRDENVSLLFQKATVALQTAIGNTLAYYKKGN